MLQISTGRFFDSDKVNDGTFQTFLYSNLTICSPIIASGCELRLLPEKSDGVAAYALSYTVRYQPTPDDILQLPLGDEASDQFRLLASLWFDAVFHRDVQYVQTLTRPQAEPTLGDAAPAGFVPSTFDRRGEVALNTIKDFSEFLNKALGMPRCSYTLLISCLTAYTDALEAIDKNIDLSYSMFAYVLEGLGQGSEAYTPTWADMPGDVRDALDRDLAGIPVALAESIRAKLVSERHLKLLKRFKDFTVRHMSDEFFLKEAETRCPALRRNELHRALETLYDSRSGYVHALKRIQESVRLPGWNRNSDVFHWDYEPYLTLSGAARLCRHVLLNFIRSEPFTESEDYPSWRWEIPGLIMAQLAPSMWIGRTDTFTAESASSRYTGLLSLLAVGIRNPPLAFPGLGPVVEAIEKCIPAAKKEHRRSLVAFYWLYHVFVAEEYRRRNWREVISRYDDCLKECTAGIMGGLVLIGATFPWDADECGHAFDDYLRRKYKPTSINLPQSLEVAVEAAIANLYLKASSTAAFREWSHRALLDAAGDPAVQTHVANCTEMNVPIDLAVVLHIPHRPIGESEPR